MERTLDDYIEDMTNISIDKLKSKGNKGALEILYKIGVKEEEIELLLSNIEVFSLDSTFTAVLLEVIRGRGIDIDNIDIYRSSSGHLAIGAFTNDIEYTKLKKLVGPSTEVFKR